MPIETLEELQELHRLIASTIAYRDETRRDQDECWQRGYYSSARWLAKHIAALDAELETWRAELTAIEEQYP